MISSTLQRSLDRISLAIREQRAEVGVSQRELAALAGVSRDTISKVERGDRIRPDLLLRIGGALTVLEVYATPPVPEPFAEAAASLSRFVVDGNGEAAREEVAA